jgi:hypothetical protein
VNVGAALRRARTGAVVAVLTGALTAALAGCSSGAVDFGSTQPPAAQQAACRSLLDALPRHVADQPARSVKPTHGWGAAWGDPPIVLTCGGPAPHGYGRASSCTTVNGVDWYLPEDQLQAGGAPSEVTMTTVHRSVYVRVDMPGDYWPPAATLADLSSAVKATIPRAGHCL